MIIDEIIKDIKATDKLNVLKEICDKMQSEHEYESDIFDNVEILYYHKYHENQYFENVLTLSYDLLEEDAYYIDKWEISKFKNDKDVFDFKKLKSKKIKMNSSPKNIIIEFAKVLKGIQNE